MNVDSLKTNNISGGFILGCGGCGYRWPNLKLFHGDFMDILNKIYVYLKVLRARAGQNINVLGGSREKVTYIFVGA